MQAEYTHAPRNGDQNKYGNLVSQRRLASGVWVPSYYQYDALGSALQLSSSALAVTDSYAYKGFGEQLAFSGTTVNPFRFVGQLGYYYDPDTSDYYVRMRIYDPVKGRWQNIDPLWFVATVNWYRAFGYEPGDPGNSTSRYWPAPPVDPFTLAGDDANVYRYGENDPTTISDYSGLQPPGKMQGRPATKVPAEPGKLQSSVGKVAKPIQEPGAPNLFQFFGALPMPISGEQSSEAPNKPSPPGEDNTSPVGPYTHSMQHCPLSPPSTKGQNLTVQQKALLNNLISQRSLLTDDWMNQSASAKSYEQQEAISKNYLKAIQTIDNQIRSFVGF